MYKATVTCTDHKTYHATGNHLAFDMGHDAEGASPIDVLLASLCGCISHYVGIFLDREAIAFEAFEVGANCMPSADNIDLGRISVDIHVQAQGAALSASAKEALCSFVTQCRVYRSLGASTRVKIRADQESA